MARADWERAERKHAKESGEKLTPRSGAGIVRKGDSYSDDRISETKYSSRVDEQYGAYIIAEAEWFDKTLTQAKSEGKDAAVVLVLGPGLSRFVFNYAPFDEAPSGSILMRSTTKLYLRELEAGIPAIIIKGKTWLKEQ